jgi:diguanylate cyclase (GGDEF)-like protein
MLSEKLAPNRETPYGASESGVPEGAESTPEIDANSQDALFFLASVVDQFPVALTVVSEDGSPVFTNAQAKKLGTGGLAIQDAVDKKFGTSADAAVHVAEFQHRGSAGDQTILTYRKPIQIRGRSLQLVASIDFTERKKIEEDLSKRAYFDGLTGLPNRALIEAHVEDIIASHSQSTRFALAFLDIDNFKHINDYYTHAVGDALLEKVAQRIASHVRPTDMLGRISGDEFLLVLNPIASADDLTRISDSLLQQLKEPFLIEGFEILTSASIGICMYPDHGHNYEMLRRAADTAMYRVKAGDKGDAAFFNAGMGRAMQARMAHEQRLRLAVRDRQFCCAFQPKIDIRTEEIVGVEALIRLRDEEGVIQAPSDFIGLAGELGLMEELTYLAVAEVMRSIDLVDDTFGPHATISINVGAKQVGDVGFMRGICDELTATTRPERFMVEVTEDAFVAQNRFQADVVPMLREIGIKIAIDDFGTGYSSLGALADITADELKIDRSFITNIHQRARSQSVLKAIEALSGPLGMTIIAEGVETFEEAAYLQAATRIRLAQGFYYAKPMLLGDVSRTRDNDIRTSGSRREPIKSRSSRSGRSLP